MYVSWPFWYIYISLLPFPCRIVSHIFQNLWDPFPSPYTYPFPYPFQCNLEIGVGRRCCCHLIHTSKRGEVSNPLSVSLGTSYESRTHCHLDSQLLRLGPTPKGANEGRPYLLSFKDFIRIDLGVKFKLRCLRGWMTSYHAIRTNKLMTVKATWYTTKQC